MHHLAKGYEALEKIPETSWRRPFGAKFHPKHLGFLVVGTVSDESLRPDLCRSF